MHLSPLETNLLLFMLCLSQGHWHMQLYSPIYKTDSLSQPHTEEVVYSVRNTSIPCNSFFFSACVNGEIQGHCTTNTGQPHLKQVLGEEPVKESQLYQIPNSSNKTAIAQVGLVCLTLHLHICCHF